MAIFSLLSEPRHYRPCPHDMLVDVAFRDHWIQHFHEHFELVMRLAIEQYGPAAAPRALACQKALQTELAAIKKQPNRWGELNLIVVDILRQQKLIEFDLPDPFLATKDRENAAMLVLYPDLVARLDEQLSEPPAHQLLLLVEGIFAGNIFDMGTQATAHRFSQESPDFIKVRDSLEGTRPWLVDHLEAFAARALAPSGYRKAVFFIDNAGSDFLLGVVPFVRWLARRGTAVILAANTMPALNDVTVSELIILLQQLAAVDPILAELLRAGKIIPADSGGIAPLIDLRHVSESLNQLCADVDLVILEGMGRAVGSNFDAQFTVDSVKVCMLKDPIIADRLGGKTFDTVFRFDSATPRP